MKGLIKKTCIKNKELKDCSTEETEILGFLAANPPSHKAAAGQEDRKEIFTMKDLKGRKFFLQELSGFGAFAGYLFSLPVCGWFNPGDPIHLRFAPVAATHQKKTS
jgi:hypothetical protein